MKHPAIILIVLAAIMLIFGLLAKANAGSFYSISGILFVLGILFLLRETQNNNSDNH
ncbi:hypothetical protein IV38_GL001628 [Lactobacillus selangorensis]|uniref:Secreted protein n=1 Tax=Lactobacillus selangorensis TaxID=81857 RepID=A0A0R2FI09_9LACO|nr:hypothetical protein [Lactobacillus selangorensis]KRN28176.1 hypothetical protein IV38_GL001628 [Lactobacillus selangorensis]KRN30948.1 hypothetical protein IV40_GL001587 [Lactobacillus selangorensis]